MLNKNMILKVNKLAVTITLIFLPPFFLGSSASNYVAPEWALKQGGVKNGSGTPIGQGRFGEGRVHSKTHSAAIVEGFGDYAHQGVDITASEGTPLYSSATGKVVGFIYTGGGGGNGFAVKPNGQDIIINYWHMRDVSRKFQLGSDVQAGDFVGTVGGTTIPGDNTKGIIPRHLHLGVGVRSASINSNEWLNNSGGTVVKTRNSAVSAPLAKGGYIWSNPAPYLPKDVIVVLSGKYQPDKLIPWIGNSIRSQYNAVTGANLPLGAGAKAGEKAHLIPKVKVSSNTGVPNDVRSQEAQQAVVNVIANNPDAQADLSSQSQITPEQLAVYAPPRTIFSGDSNQVTVDVGDGNLSKSDLIDKIANSRFGNEDYQKQLLSLSMRGMLVEYLNTINAKNFIKREQIRQQERIEALYATWLASLTKLNLNAEYVEGLEKEIHPDIVPEISKIPLEQMVELIQSGGTPSNVDYSSTVSLNEGKEFAMCGKTKDSRGIESLFQKWQGKKQLLALAFKYGFNPNDLANAVAMETTFTEQYPTSDYLAAVGVIQLTPTGASGINLPMLMEKSPAVANILRQQGFVTNSATSAFLSKNTRKHIGLLMKPLHQNNMNAEYMVYDAYFGSKVPTKSWLADPARKNIAFVYTQILGNPIYKSKNLEAYTKNSGLDTNHDDVISADEAVLSQKFLSRHCNYFPDQDIAANKHGLTNEDLKITQWNKSFNTKIPFQPTVGNYGGNYAYIQTLKEKVKQEGSL